MKYITTFDTVFLCLALLQLLECYVRVRIACYHHLTEQSERYQKIKRPIELVSLFSWMAVLAIAGNLSLAGMTTFILFCAIARTLFAVLLLQYNDRKYPEIGEVL
jgi:hypothetical protein